MVDGAVTFSVQGAVGPSAGNTCVNAWTLAHGVDPLLPIAVATAPRTFTVTDQPLPALVASKCLEIGRAHV